MALEAVVYPQDPFTSYVFDDFTTVGGGAFLGIFDNSTNWDSSSTHSIMQHAYSSPETCTADQSLPTARVIFSPLTEPPASATTMAATNSGRKRRWTRSSKNKEELENQRMNILLLNVIAGNR
ncbi:hypothetical protein V6N13_140178 [Hibiscus sabdariffa]|uniref:Uncharacterized protein n=1 Tax=Hibiscus sabdariffa TaxID=183260 RepID=A0ABR2QB93_9ROSI